MMDITSCPNCASRLLPAWFVPRMMTDEWYFGLLLTTGSVLEISGIDSVSQAADGNLWIDVRMILDSGIERKDMKVMHAPTSRLQASINAAHIVAAFELADT